VGGPVRSGPGQVGRPGWGVDDRSTSPTQPAGRPPVAGSRADIHAARARYRSVFITRNIVPIEFVAQVANETAGSCHAEVTRGENFQELAI